MDKIQRSSEERTVTMITGECTPVPALCGTVAIMIAME